ncbi:HsdM family class I SAM-dependent methyltransferase [Owenweeksia hongkongensis]|uniref:HsdM family class I SAM-dependent methyltransferase n=1 Tax=Owenweeksia hongkongensis TaxID=253245 RepID=UPI003A94D823
MNRTLLKYLEGLDCTTSQVDRLVVTAFLFSNRIKPESGSFIESYVIREEDEDYQSFLSFQKLFAINGFEDLIRIFEFVISPQDKIVTGAVYTPLAIREYIVDKCLECVDDLDNVMICDPSCGCSGFLLTAAKLIHERTAKSYTKIFMENVFGLDIQKYSVQRSKILLTLFALSEGETRDIPRFNIFHGNALNFLWKDNINGFLGFDVIVGNPPYVCSRNIEDESKRYIFDWEVSSSGHPDLYIPFFQIGIENLRPEGMLGYITMNTFFKSVNGRALRKYFDEQPVSLQILDFGSNQIFESKTTYTCICLIRNESSDVLKYARGSVELLHQSIEYEQIPYAKLNNSSGWNLQQHDLLNRIEKTGQPFGQLYTTRNGIATLKNHVYIFKEIDEDDSYYYLQNGDIYPIEKGICKGVINPNKFTRATSVNELLQNAIFPYEFDSNGNAKLISEEIMESEFPMAFRYLMSKRDLLSTRDKGKGRYENWYAYGRNQSLERFEYKLFFPHITPHIPNYTLSDDADLLFYNGIAVVSEDVHELKFVQKLMSSELFWFYITHSSKPYGSGYFSLSRNYIKGFGVAEFTLEEKRAIANADQSEANRIIRNKYNIPISVKLNSNE